jgi:hypothetical protein
MKYRLLDRAEQDLEAIADDLADKNPRAAFALVERFHSRWRGTKNNLMHCHRNSFVLIGILVRGLGHLRPMLAWQHKKMLTRQCLLDATRGTAIASVAKYEI